MENMIGSSTSTLGRPLYDVSPLTEEDKERARQADPNGGRCLVTNTSYCIEACHCIHRSLMKKEEILDSLEWAWNMKRYSLNLNTHYNIFFAKSDIHTLFDRKKWLLLPEESIIDIFHKSLIHKAGVSFAKRKNFPLEFSEETFLYKFVPIQDVDDLPIMRKGETPENDIIYYAPYNTFPILRSHLHPKFAIFDAGRKMGSSGIELERHELQIAIEDHPKLKKIHELYIAWTRKIPKHALDDESYHDPNVILVSSSEDGNEDNVKDKDYIGRTISGRGDGYLPRTRSVIAAAERNRRITWSVVARTRSVASKQEGNDGPRPGVRNVAARQHGHGDGQQAKPKRGRGAGKRKARKVLPVSSAHTQQLHSEANLFRSKQQPEDGLSWDILRWRETIPQKIKYVKAYSFSDMG